MSYNCKFGFYHDKPCQTSINELGLVEYEPSSNNGWIYSAIALFLKLPIDAKKICDTYGECRQVKSIYFMVRSPDKYLPPMSRDEVLGVTLLGIKELPRMIRANEWTWLNDLHKFKKYKLWDTIKAFWEARNQHRNFLWENSRYESYQYLFKLGFADRYYINRVLKIKPRIIERLAWTIHKRLTLHINSPGELNILYLQCIDINDKFYKKINFEKNIIDYFGEDHVFSKRVK